MKKNGPIRIWIDCDPGIDDAIALAAAAASRDQLHLLGISTVAGNQTSDRVTKNALELADFLGLGDVPVVRGARGPLVREQEAAAEVHGETGIGNCRLPETKKQTASENAVTAIWNCLAGLPEGETLTMVPTGPLTNIALLLKAFPEAAGKIEKLVLMGGSVSGGNVTPWAEFNLWEDPEAARIVFRSGLPVVQCGLDVTSQCGLTRTQIDELFRDENPVRRACGEMLQFYADSPNDHWSDLVVIHDVVTILYLTDPQLFGGIPAEVDVNCSWGERRGETFLRSENGPVLLLNRADTEGFQRCLLEKLSRF